jgi:hypothetical protein
MMTMMMMMVMMIGPWYRLLVSRLNFQLRSARQLAVAATTTMRTTTVDDGDDVG